MRTTTARQKPMPRCRSARERWLAAALAWLLFCAAMVAVGLFLTPRIGTSYAAEKQIVPAAGSTLVADMVEAAVPMAATVLYPNEPGAVGAPAILAKP